MSAASERPQPAYGEYATPEQVARARGMSLDEYERHLAEIARPLPAAKQPDAASVTPSEASPAAAPRPTAEEKAAAPAAKPSASRPGNRFVTIALLAFGLACSLITIPSLLALGDGVAGAFAAQGLDPFTSWSAARVIGVIAVVVQLLLWLATLALSLAALRRGRTSWWIPLVGGALAVLIVSALWLVAIFIDPAFVRYIEQVSLQV